MPSFSQKTKTDVSGIMEKYKCCRLSLLYGLLYGATEYGRDRIRLSLENEETRRLFEKLMKSCISEDIRSDDGKYLIDGTAVLERIGEEFFEGDAPAVIKRSVFTCANCFWAFLRGVFLSCGTVTSPKSEYHLEMTFRDAERAAELRTLLEEKELTPKLTVRESSVGVYFKESEKIEDVLFRIGANKASFDFMNEKILKGVANNINRTNNFLAANMMKSVTAGQKQLNAIYKIADSGAVSMLPRELKETFDLRAANPDAPLSELAGMHKPPLTRSGVNHRLQKIVDFADKLGK